MDGKVVAAVVLMLALAGCVTPGSDSKGATSRSGGFQGTLRTYEDPTATVDIDSPKGGFRGQVLNVRGAPLGSSHVTVTGTSLFMTTGADGRFEFLDLDPKTYRIRVNPGDAESYHSFEGPVTVVAGKIGYIDVVLEAKVDQGSIHHFHDRWENKTAIDIVNGDFKIPPEGPLCGVSLSSSIAPALASSGPVPAHDTSGGHPWLDNTIPCGVIDIYPKDNTIVPPGTKELRVKIDWDRREHVPDVTFKFMTPNVTIWRTHANVLPGSELVIAIDKPGKVMNISDHGHQHNSLWAFQLVIDPRVIAGPVSREVVHTEQFNEQFVGDFQVRIVAVKGDAIPAEPPHARFWQAGPSIKVIDGVEQTLAINGATYRQVGGGSCFHYSLCFTLPAEKANLKLVPPGTTRMKITLKTTFGSDTLSELYHEKGLAFRTAAQSYRGTTLEDLRVVPPKTHSLSEVTWEFPVSEKEADPYYQGKSTWLFLVGNLGDERNPEYTPDCFNTGCGGETFRLTVEVFNDDWTPELAA